MKEEKKEKEKEKRRGEEIVAVGHTGQSKVVQEVLADLKMKNELVGTSEIMNRWVNNIPLPTGDIVIWIYLK